MVAVDEGGKKLAVHALVGVIAEDGLVRASEVIERVVPGSAFEVLALVVAGQHRASR